MKPDWFEIFSIIAFPVCFFWLLKIVYDDGKESGIEQLKVENERLNKLAQGISEREESISAEHKLRIEIESENAVLKSKLEIAKKALEKIAYEGSSRELCTKICEQALKEIEG